MGTGLALVLGEGLQAGAVATAAPVTVPLLSQIPLIGPIFFTNQSVLVYLGYLLVPLAWYYIYRTRPGLHLRAVGEYPAAADALGVTSTACATSMCSSAGMLAGLAGATISWRSRRAGSAT